MSGRTTEEQKLVEFFRTEGADLGVMGDYYSMTPAETAIRAMRVLLSHSKHCKRLRTAMHEAGI